MAATGVWPTQANFATTNGKAVTDQQAAEGDALWRIAARPTTNIGGTANAVTADSLIGSFASLQEGNQVTVTPTSDNTDAVTLNLDALGDTPVKTAGGAALASGQWKAGITHLLKHDGTNWRVIAPPIEFSYGPEIAAEEEPTSDVTEIVVTGLSAYRDIEFFAVGQVNAAATLSISGREPAGTWRIVGSLVFGAAAGFVAKGNLRNFGSATKPKLAEVWIDSDIGTLTRSTENLNVITPPSATATWYTYLEAFDEFKLSVSAGSLEGSDADKRCYLRIEGQR